MRNIPWLSTALLAVGATVVLVPNLLLHFVLDALVSYRLVAIVLAGAAIAAFGFSAWRAAGRPTRRSAAICGLVAALAVTGVTLGRDWLSYERAAFAFRADDAVLQGTLFLPSAIGRFPAVVIAHGSPALPRRLYTVWADALVRDGFAVLIFDKRGTGESGGSYDQQNNSSPQVLERFGRDLAAAADALAADPRVDRMRISFLGLSQAGWTVPAALQHTRNVASFVLISGPTCTNREEGTFSDATGESAGADWARRRLEADAQVLKAGPGGFDPLPYLRGSNIRGHWIFGSRDASIPVTRSSAILDELIAAGRPYSYETMDEADHLQISWRGGLPDFDPRMWAILKREFRKTK
jgi:dienelactone hydrolase